MRRDNPDSMIFTKEETVQRSMWNGLAPMEELTWLMQEKADASQEPMRSELVSQNVRL